MSLYIIIDNIFIMYVMERTGSLKVCRAPTLLTTGFLLHAKPSTDTEPFFKVSGVQ